MITKLQCTAVRLTRALLLGVLWLGTTSTASAEGIANGLNINVRNPLDGIDSIPDLVVTILEIVITIAIPIIIFFIVVAGFKYVTARGNAQQIQEANRALTYAILGGILVIGSVALAEIIKNVIVAF